MKYNEWDAWLKLCEENKTEIYPLEGGKPEGTGLFQTRTAFWVRNTKYFRTPTYQVWAHKKRLLCSTDYQEALACWNNYKEGLLRD